MNRSLKWTWLQFLLFVAVSLCFTACGKDDKNEPSDSDDFETASIIGTWTAEEDNYDYTTTYRLTFTSKGEFSYLSVDSDDGYSESGKGNYVISDNILRVKILWDDDNEWETNEYRIISLTSKELVLRGDDFSGTMKFVKSK